MKHKTFYWIPELGGLSNMNMIWIFELVTFEKLYKSIK